MSGDITDGDLPEAVAEHRTDYWEWVENHADTRKRDALLELRDHWHEINEQFFEGRMHLPYITLTEPSKPSIYGQCCSQSSWGSRLEIKLRPSLLWGTHPHMCPGSGYASGRMKFVKDVLTHEMIHQHVMEHQPTVDEESYHGHGPVFTGHCNRISAGLGLPQVIVRNRPGRSKTKAVAPQWPHCVVDPVVRYDGAYSHHRKDRVTCTHVTIPAGCHVASMQCMDDAGEFVRIDFDTDTGDKSVEIRIHVDTLGGLVDFAHEFLCGDKDV
ncbi:MAG: SprT-like domain-containing protein [Nocardiaceae bacterium]|nr:SprT-like domain-containing protein [Nocardiaceae bacterium]